MKCCAECFGDRGLRENIIPSKSQAAIEVGQYLRIRLRGIAGVAADHVVQPNCGFGHLRLGGGIDVLRQSALDERHPLQAVEQVGRCALTNACRLGPVERDRRIGNVRVLGEDRQIEEARPVLVAQQRQRGVN